MSERFKAYNAYLESEEWRIVKRAGLRRDGGCVACIKLHNNPEGFLHGHHLRYPEDIWQTNVDHIVTLCGSCHNTLHHAVRHYGVAQPTELGSTIALIEEWISEGRTRLPDKAFINWNNSKRGKPLRIKARAEKRKPRKKWGKVAKPIIRDFMRKGPSVQAVEWLHAQLMEAVRRHAA